MITTKIDKRSRHSIQVCNGLLHEEISAVETYKEAIERFSDEPEAGELRSIRHGHASSVEALRQHILSMGGLPGLNSAAWRTFSCAIEKADHPFDKKDILLPLHRGEEQCQTEYLNALDDVDVLPESKRLIRAELLRRSNDHLLVLQALARSE